jgi:hypothetical protein
MHALPHRRGARRRDDRPHRAPATPPPPAADRPLRHDEVGSLCALGGFTPYPVMSALTHFPDDFARSRARMTSRELRPPPLGKEAAGMKDFIMTLPDRNRLRHPRRRRRKTVTSPSTASTVTVPEGTSVMRAGRGGHRRSRSSAPPTASSLRLLPPLPGRDRGPRGTPPPAPRRSRPAWSSTPRPSARAPLRKRRDGALHLRPPARLPDLRANGDCELQDMAGAVGLRDVRYGYDGRQPLAPARHGGEANPQWLPKDDSNPYFTYDPPSASSARAACAPARRCRAPSR